jgi:hypothetical protein
MAVHQPPRIRHFYLFLEQGGALPLNPERKYPAVSSPAARDLGKRGPTSHGRRVVARKVYRTTNGINGRVLKNLGL